ncbi:MAG TPA: CPBP family intramembrane glutamic endopeptidase, partial [Verrucomicrobiaceae bacterium]
VAGNFRSIATDFGVALGFWIGSLFVLANIGIFWTLIEAAIKHKALFTPGKPLAPDAAQEQTLHTLTRLAPVNGIEITAWIGLCIIAGLVEEVVFRGYLQRQFTAWARGTVAVGVAGSAIFFGAAHGYQGARNMILLAVFGALFSFLALFRRSLRPGIFAHSWHDLLAGLALAFLKAHHKL